MNFPQFWAKGQSGDFLVWRWSSKSLADAQARASQAAQELAARFRAGGFPPKHGGYYPNRPFREQILKEFRNAAGDLSALVTRNSYGCQVLNTARVMFVDIDLPEPPRPRGLGFSIRILDWPKPKPPPDMSGPRNAALAKVENWTRDNNQWGWRIYQTRAGLRLLATQSLVEADSNRTAEMFQALGTDTLYQMLCQTQKCFRARLTPKPWRCGVFSKPERWPWPDAKREKRFQKWETDYLASSEEYATCEFLRQIGNSEIHPEVQPIVKLHDDMTRAGSKLPLA